MIGKIADTALASHAGQVFTQSFAVSNTGRITLSGVTANEDLSPAQGRFQRFPAPLVPSRWFWGKR